MEREAILVAVTSALSDVLERDLGVLGEEVRLSEDLHLDSTLMLEMLMAIEEQFDLEVDPEELTIEDFATIGTLTSLVERIHVRQVVPR